MSFEKCQKRIKSYFSVFVLLILLTNESRVLVSCQSVGDGVRSFEASIPPLMQQTVGDLTPSETFNLPGLDTVRGFLVRNYEWLTPVAAAVPAKLATFMTLRALRQQAVEQEQQQQQQINGMRNVGDGQDCTGGDCAGGDDDPGGDVGCGEGGCCGNGCDDEKKNSMMLFVGDGNIQVKNHGDEDDEDTNDKYYTYQKIDLAKKFMNKDMTSMNSRKDEDVRRIWRKVRKNKSKPKKKKKKRRQKSTQNSSKT